MSTFHFLHIHFFVHSKLSTFQFLHIWNWSHSILCTFAIFCTFHFLHGHYPSVPKVQARLLTLMKIFTISQLHTPSVLNASTFIWFCTSIWFTRVSCKFHFCTFHFLHFLHIPLSAHSIFFTFLDCRYTEMADFTGYALFKSTTRQWLDGTPNACLLSRPTF